MRIILSYKEFFIKIGVDFASTDMIYYTRFHFNSDDVDE